MNEDKNIIVGFDAKRVVRNGTGLGAYGRNLVNDLAALYPHMQLLLYAPDEGLCPLFIDFHTILHY